MLAMCCIEAGGNILYKPEVRQGSSSRNGRRDWAFISASSCSWYLIRTCCRCRELLTHENKTCECWASVELTAIAEKRKEEESMDLFWLVTVWGICICETLICDFAALLEVSVWVESPSCCLVHLKAYCSGGRGGFLVKVAAQVKEMCMVVWDRQAP